jgi:site-specific DNA recombinase
LRFAFYARASTGRFQDPASSRGWQLHIAAMAIDGAGQITATFFDVGYSPSVPWRHRPQASTLLAEAARPDRRFDAVVIGEFERAFSRGQAGRSSRSLTLTVSASGWPSVTAPST